MTKKKNKSRLSKLEFPVDQSVANMTNLLSIKENLKCQVCDTSFQDHCSLAYHSKRHTKGFACHFCNFKCKQKYQIRRHLNRHGGYKCQICEKFFKRAATALVHSYIHGEEKKFKCQKCEARYLTPQKLKAHTYKAHKQKPDTKPPAIYECDKCNKKYGSKQTLRRHFSSNHQEMGVDISLICEVCGKRLETITSYRIHVRSHTGQKPFKCSFCDKAFAARCRLTTHIRTHTGEKPYVCSFCGKKFGQHAPYWYHMRTHTNDRKHVCRVCGKRFISQSNMNLHVKTCFAVKKD